MKTSNVGLIGLAVMGENLALNRKVSFTVSVLIGIFGRRGVVDRLLGRAKAKFHWYAFYDEFVIL